MNIVSTFWVANVEPPCEELRWQNSIKIVMILNNYWTAVFVICRIINVEVRVISQAEGELIFPRH